MKDTVKRLEGDRRVSDRRVSDRRVADRRVRHLPAPPSTEGKTLHNNTKKGEKEHELHELHLLQFLEKSVYEFVRKVKHSRPKKLYNLLISEFEKPIFHAALQEMEGNQIRAAELLGMHRNTLRKKIKALKIPIKKRDAKSPK